MGRNNNNNNNNNRSSSSSSSSSNINNTTNNNDAFNNINDDDDEHEPLLLSSKGDEGTTAVDDAAAGQNQPNKSKMLVISFVLLVVVGLGNKIFQKLQAVPMKEYPLFLSIYTVAFYVPISFMYIIPMIIWGSKITPEQRQVSQWKFAVMGGLDSIASIMQTFAVNYISGTLIILLPQVAIPISMVMSYFMLSARYKWFHIVGAVIVICGLVLSVIPTFIKKDNASATVDENDHGPSVAVQGIYMVVLILSCIPMTLSSIYKERALRNVDMDHVYLNGWIAVWQFIIGLILLIPSVYAQVPVDGVRYGVKDLPSLLLKGVQCYVGIGTGCELAPTFVNIYLFFNVSYNVLILLILQFGNANLLWLAMTIMVPLGSIAFSLPFMPESQPLKALNIVGLLVIMFGLILYRFYETLQRLFRSRFSNFGEILQKPHPVSLRLRADALEGAQYFYDIHEQDKLLGRNPAQIRTSYLSRLGIPYNRGQSPDTLTTVAIN